MIAHGRAWLVASVVGVLSAALIIAVVLVQSKWIAAPSGGGELAASQEAFPPGIAQRVEGQIAAVSAESVLETVANLAESGMYFSPGAHGERAAFILFPVPAREGGRDIETILSNRRFLKVCEELTALGPEAATELLNDCIPAYLEGYRGVVDEYLDMVAGQVGPGTRCGVGFQIGGPPDGRPNPLGPRFRLLALVLAAGNLELQGTHDALLKVAEEALSQRQRFYREGEFNQCFRFGMVTVAGLYNRQVLGYALLKTSPDPRLADDVLAALGKEVVVREVTVFDAQRTRYDARYMPGPVDYTKGILAVEYLPPISDEEFDVIVEAVLPAQGNEAN